MRARIKIIIQEISVVVESDDSELARAAQKVIETNEEQIESAMFAAVRRHLEQLLPGMSVTTIGIDGEDL